MISDHDQSAVARVVYLTYTGGLWPIGTLFSGLEGLGLLWPMIAAIPIYAFEYFQARRRDANNENPNSKIITFMAASVLIFVPMLGIYFLGISISYFWA